MEHKHHSFKPTGSRKSNSRFGTIFFLLVSIALIAGIVVLSPLGEYLMNHVITPIISCASSNVDHEIVSALKQQEDSQATKSPSAKPTETAHEVITIEEIPFYILQMGAFTDAEAANQHAEEIRRMGAGGTVYKENSIYRVFAAAYTDDTSLKTVQSQVRADGFEATPYITESKGIRITLEGDIQAVSIVKEASQTMNRIPAEMCTLCLAYDKGEISDEMLLEELESKRSECTHATEEMGQLDTTDVDAIRDILQKYNQNISTFLDEHDTMESKMISGALKHLQLSMIIDYILFFDQE